MKKKILIGITGGIAAVKVPELLGHLKKRDADIDVIMTQSARKIVNPVSIEKITGHKVFTDLFPGSFDPEDILSKRSVEHVELGQQADLFVIVPATANTIAKLAAGIADDFLTTAALAATCPMLVCPSMNVFMWNNPATQKNIETLHRYGIHTFGPDAGMLACGYEGKGRLPQVGSIEHEIFRFLERTDSLKGKKVIVTAGGTVEPIDDVRVITNKSSGKMGVALAESAYLHGADVLLLRSSTAVSSRYGIPEEIFDTAADLRSKLTKHLPGADIVIHAAAVSDFTVKNPTRGKSSSDVPLSLELEPQMKILDALKSVNPGIFLVAFKAEYDIPADTLIKIARKRLQKARADMIVVNDVSRSDSGFTSDYNEVTIINKRGQTVHVPRNLKSEIADRIIGEITASV